MDKEVQTLQKLTAPLLEWYDTYRRDLPWRQEVSAYGTWISEIMLQQTRVRAVIPYFQRFMAAFPTVKALAAADTEQLLKLWEGLGYYSRARNLQKAARIVAERYGGRMPDTYDELIALPGIGDYTAGAILSISYGQRVPAVDGNVLRIAARITGSRMDVLDGGNRKVFRRWVEQAMPAERTGEYNQALMDLGATVCLSGGEPLCPSCPAGEICQARRQGCQRQLPVRKKKKDKRVEHLTVFVLLRGGAVALRQRPERGLLAQLWEYPHVPGTLDETAAARQMEQWSMTPHRWIKQLTARHEFTHIRWEMTGYVIEAEGSGAPDWLWADGQTRRRYAVPSAFDKFTREVEPVLIGDKHDL
ncbi:MAG: A/G-specific adenine glycosylase [Oscillospiraceae bacterium]|nr:A/G-specific adenine glycosylase [Oscillospiraceae bacterium]